MHIEDKLIKISSMLSNDGIILIQPDHIWGLVCCAYNEEIIKKLIGLPMKMEQQYHEIIVSDIIMLKKHVPHLHPRVETLLSYHERPIRLVFDEVKQINTEVSKLKYCIRIVKDKFTRRLISTIGNPLYVRSFHSSDKVKPIKFEEIDQSVLPSLSYIHSQTTKNKDFSAPILTATFDEEGMINVLT